MLNRLRAALASAFASDSPPVAPTPPADIAPPAPAAAETATAVRPPVDLNRPVENPDLVRALDWAAETDSDEAKDALFAALQRANFLAAVLTDNFHATPEQPPASPGQVTIAKGSTIKFLTAMKDGKHYLPLFTDWPAIHAYRAGRDDAEAVPSVSGLVLPARDAWAMALAGDTYAGAVVNPGGNALPLMRPMLEILAAQSA